MDALKRAEKARQERARKEGGTPVSETQELSLESIAEGIDASREEDEPAADAPGERPAAGGEAHASAPAEAPAPLEADLEPPPAQAGPAGAEGTPSGTPSEQASGERKIEWSLVEDQALDANDTSTLPSLKAARASVDQYFDGADSQSLEMRPSGDEDAGDTTVTGQRQSFERGSRASAQAVFDAKSPPVSRRGPSLLVLVGLPLILVVLAGGGWYYWTTLSSGPAIVQRKMPALGAVSPVTPPTDDAATVASAPPAATQPRSASAPEPPPAPAATASEPDAERTARATAPASRVAAAGESGDVPDPPVPAEPPQQPQPVAATAAAPGATTGMPTDDALEVMASELAPPALMPEEMLSGGEIRISRRQVPGRVPPQLTEAYRAYRAGDLDGARAGYARVLEERPRNRDALLGLAAVAVVEGRRREAAALYARLLQMDPRDAVAQAALVSLRDQPDPVASESRIKLLLEREPESAHLHFILGNLYAAQGRWPEAQSAYFDALRHDSANPDYALNLAISLDHLEKPRAAASFYRRALGLADARRAGFEPATVLDRLRQLAAAPGDQ